VTEKILAAVTLAVCLVLMVRLLLGERLRWRFDAAVRRSASACKQRALRAYHWRSSRRAAERAAEDVIRRARGDVDGEWQGNVYKPKSFRKPRKLH